MRKIEFRGKTIAEPSVWVFGGVVPPNPYNPNWAIWSNGHGFNVHEKSVGQLIEHQFWNEEDDTKSRRYIYEGDILLTCARADLYDYEWDRESKPDFLMPYLVAVRGARAVLLDKNGGAVEQWSDGEIDSYGIELSGCGYEEVIGNYFDNPELMN